MSDTSQKQAPVFFLESETGRPAPSSSRFHIIPVPFEASVSYRNGTARGPGAIIAASQQLELYDGASYPSEEGIYTYPPLDCNQPKTGHNNESVNVIFNKLRFLVDSILDKDAIPVVLGGEHSISYAPVMAAFHRHGSGLGIVQIDAHADLRLTYQNKVWSHASVMRRLTDQGIPLLQLGVRGICREELEYRDSKDSIVYYDANELVRKEMREIILADSFPPYVYLSLDVDGLDPSIMPATGTPVPGGLPWYQCLDLISSVARQRKIIAFDCVEFAPFSEFHAADFTAAQLVYNSMGIIQRKCPQGNPK